MLNFISTAPRAILQKLVRQYANYTKPLPLRVAIGTYNINGGKHFRSIVYKDVSLSDWLLDAHKTEKTHGKKKGALCHLQATSVCNVPISESR